jgi:hypothetical protein
MERFDSRHLTDQDSFCQFFERADEYIYLLSQLPPGINAENALRFSLKVRPGGASKGAGKQHDVKVYWDADRRCYRADPDGLEIKTNDYVMWHSERVREIAPYAVHGVGKSGSFTSSSLGPNAGFSDLFLAAGSYDYEVSGRGPYSISVLDHRIMAPDEYKHRASTAPLILIRNGVPILSEKNVPKGGSVEIVAGQTVVWLAEDDREIVISSVSRTVASG